MFWRERIVLLAVPKTGATALEAALAAQASLALRHPPGPKHMAPGRYRRAVLPLLAAAGEGAFETVAVVRHPVAWLSSCYRHRSREDIAGRPKSTRGMTFDAFVEARLRAARAAESRAWEAAAGGGGTCRVGRPPAIPGGRRRCRAEARPTGPPLGWAVGG